MYLFPARFLLLCILQEVANQIGNLLNIFPHHLPPDADTIFIVLLKARIHRIDRPLQSAQYVLDSMSQARRCQAHGGHSLCLLELLF